ncbi:MAG: protein kinase domain-containing protein [Polyangiaceae bacterium]
MGDPPSATLPVGTPSGGVAQRDSLARGALIDRYVVLSTLGRGGMGHVYLAFDGELERRVAIKVLRAEGASGGSTAQTRARLLREAQAMAKVTHPNVATVYDVGTFGAEVFIAMEYVRGETLRQWQAARPRSAREILEAYVQAGRGLAAAHAEGILHRDFKPDNVLVDERGRAKVLDFGLARLETGAPPDRRISVEILETPAPTTSLAALDETFVEHKQAATPLTEHGTLLGTPAYMAPEQLLAQPATARSDQFAFGVALYEALTGERPFEGNTIGARVASIRSGKLKAGAREARVAGSVRRAIARAMRGEADERFASMDELLAALERGLRAPRERLAAVAAVAVALVVAGGLFLRSAKPKLCQDAKEALAQTWSEARAGEIERAFLATGSLRASEAFTHARTVLDRYAASWVRARTEACEATHVRGEQSAEGLDLRMACLNAHEKEMKATLDLFAKIDAKGIDRAAQAAAELPSVEDCADVLALRAPFARPKDDVQARAVEDVRKKLADIRALHTMERAKEAAPLATAAVDEATRAGYEPVLAETLLIRGEIERSLDEPREAEDTLFRAAVLGEAVRHDSLAARAWTSLMELKAGDLVRPVDVDRITELAGAATRRVGSDLARSDLLYAKAQIAYARGHSVEMRDFAAEATALSERALGPEHPQTLNIRQSLADALWDGGDVEHALPLYTEIHRARVELLGPTSPPALRSLADMGLARIELGDYAEGVRLLEETTRHPQLPAIETQSKLFLAEALVGAGRLAEGLALFGDTVAAAKAAGSETRADIPGATADFSRVLALREDDREALAFATKALAALEERRPQERGEAFGARALSKARLGDAKGALEDASLALATPEKYLGERADLVPLCARADAKLALGDMDGARETLDRALPLADKYQGDRAIRAEIRFAMARAAGDPVRAGELARSAADALAADGLADRAAQVRAWIQSSVASARGR